MMAAKGLYGGQNLGKWSLIDVFLWELRGNEVGLGVAIHVGGWE